MTTGRESWGSRIGFVFAAVGSAVGLANIVRFPYMVGQHGGAAFIVIYLMCLALLGFPILISEILIGRTTHRNPAGAFAQLGNSKFWAQSGLIVVGTGFVVSAFYSALAGWILGYLFEALQGNLNSFVAVADAVGFFREKISLPLWPVCFHGLFMFISAMVLYSGVRTGLERSSKFFMPLMFIVLLYLCYFGLRLPNTSEALKFVFVPEWHKINITVILLALGQAFFTLSLGQGTMITYGSYLSRRENIISSCLPIVLADTFISILAAISVMCIVFGVGMDPSGGIGLLFHTLPVVFSKLPAGQGQLLAILFFSLVTLAALTSEISALEPGIAYLIDEKGWPRNRAVLAISTGAFLVGIPSAMSYSFFKDITINGMVILECMDFAMTAIFIPFGALLAVILLGWRWGINQALVELSFGSTGILTRRPWLDNYFRITIRYIAPLLILVIATSHLY